VHVAFFRNLNLGQPGSPSRGVLLATFAAAGATDVLSHQSNGTVAFSAPADGDPVCLSRTVADRLGPTCAYADVVLVRSLAWLRGLQLEGLPDGCEVTLFDGSAPFPEPLPWSPTPEVTVLSADRLHAIVHNHVARRSFGTRVVETRLGVRATSRGVGTVLRLLDRVG
jgi:hypothetical protein